MLRDRADADLLLELLDFHPPDWRRYYDDLFVRFPLLAGRFINVDLWNMPTSGSVDQWEIEWHARQQERARARHHQDRLMLAELRGLAMAATARRGAERAKLMRRLDRKRAEYGLRPSHPGGSRIPRGERENVRKEYEELRTVIDEVRNIERTVLDGSGDVGGAGQQYRRAVFVKYPFFTDAEMAAIYTHPYPRRGATAEAAMAILAGRLHMSPASLGGYLFPRRRRKYR